MIFILRDKFDQEKDLALAKHIISVHAQGAAAVERETGEDEFEIRFLKRYIAYARKTCSPRLEPAAAEVLQNHYVSMRQDLHAKDKDAEQNGKAPRAVPITVRQLEAIVRISESFAKMRLSDVATAADVNQAIKLFEVSTLQAAQTGEIELEGGTGREERTALEMIKQRVRIGETTGAARLVKELVHWGLEERAIRRAINMLCKRGEFEEQKMGKKLKRLQ